MRTKNMRFEVLSIATLFSLFIGSSSTVEAQDSKGLLPADVSQCMISIVSNNPYEIEDKDNGVNILATCDNGTSYKMNRRLIEIRRPLLQKATMFKLISEEIKELESRDGFKLFSCNLGDLKFEYYSCFIKKEYLAIDLTRPRSSRFLR